MLYRYLQIRSVAHDSPSPSETEATVPEPAIQSINEYFPNRQLIKEIAYSASFNSISPSIEACFNFIDVVILANKSLSTSALISIYQNLITTSCCAILGSASTIVSHAYGQHEITQHSATSKIRDTLNGGIMLSLVLSVPAFTAALSSREILNAIQQPEEILDSVQKYFFAYSWGMPAIFIVHLEKQIALGVSDIKPVIMLTIFDGLSISLLGYILVNGKLGFNEMGVAGLGYAATITNWLELCIFSLYLKYGHRFQEYNFSIFNEFKKAFSAFKELLNIGFPLGIQVSCELLIVLGYSALIGKIGEKSLSAYQISNQYIILSAIPTYGLNQATLILVGKEAGANRNNNAKIIGTTCTVSGACMSFLILVLISVISKELMKPFIDTEDPINEETVNNVRILFLVNGAAQIFDSTRIISAGSIQSAFKETKIAMLLGLANFGLLGLSLGYLLGFTANAGVVGVCLGRASGLACAGTSLFYYWLKKIRNWPPDYQSLPSTGTEDQEIFSEPINHIAQSSLVDSSITFIDNSRERRLPMLFSAGSTMQEVRTQEIQHISALEQLRA